MAYPCDLPANLGNTDIFRAIYNKIGNSDISTGRIEQKLNIISGQLANANDQLIVVNNSIEANTQAIKDISINVDIHSKDIQGITKAINKQTKAIENIQIHIDTSDLNDSVKMIAYKVEENGQLVATKVEDGFTKTVEAIKSIQPGPTPPVPPCPPPCPPHPHPKPHPHPHHHCYHSPYPYNNWDDWLYYTYGAAENYYEIVANFWYHYTNSYNYEDRSLQAYVDPE